MSKHLIIFLLALLLLQLILIIRGTRRKEFTIKYASLWIVLIIIMGVVVIYPNLIFMLSDYLGFEAASNMIFLLGFFFLFYLSFIITTSISKQNAKITLLIQEVSMLKEKVKNEKER